MNKRGLGEKIKLTSYDEMFGTEEKNEVDKKETEFMRSSADQVVELPLDDLMDFFKHPFKVEDDEKMEETVESIKESGVLVPIIVHPARQGAYKGKYEILAGHRRCHASRLAGKTTIPAIIKDCSKDEATIIMVDSNIQREDISIMEKAKAYRMKYDAVKHQGAGGGSTLEAMSDASGDNPKTIQRLIRLSYLSDDLLNAVDQKMLGMGQGVDISYLDKEEQEMVYNKIYLYKKNVSLEQSALLKSVHNEGKLSLLEIDRILADPEKVQPRKVSLNSKKLDSYFTPDMTNKDIEKVILQLLDEWKEKGGNA